MSNHGTSFCSLNTGKVWIPWNDEWQKVIKIQMREPANVPHRPSPLLVNSFPMNVVVLFRTGNAPVLLFDCTNWPTRHFCSSDSKFTHGWTWTKKGEMQVKGADITLIKNQDIWHMVQEHVLIIWSGRMHTQSAKWASYRAACYM
jgi:hypothetical protein